MSRQTGDSHEAKAVTSPLTYNTLQKRETNSTGDLLIEWSAFRSSHNDYDKHTRNRVMDTRPTQRESTDICRYTLMPFPLLLVPRRQGTSRNFQHVLQLIVSTPWTIHQAVREYTVCSLHYYVYFSTPQVSYCTQYTRAQPDFLEK